MSDDQHSNKEQECDYEFPGVDIVEYSSRERQSSQDKQPSKSLHQKWQDLGIDRQIESGVTLVGLVVAGVLAVTAINQLNAMREQTTSMQAQLAEMKAGGVETGKLIAATEKIAEAASTGAAQSKAALEATIEASRLGQRAWVGLTNIKVMTFEVGKPIRIEIIFTNTGHSPALKAKGFFYMEVKELPINIGNFNLDQMARSHKDRPSIGTTFPNATLSIQTEATSPATEKSIAEIKAGRLKILIIGKVTYLDIFQNSHVSAVCAKYEPVGKGFEYCEQHNYSN
ncbi:MAG: hypothetical protein Q8L74_02075 [Nitrospirota bacterium]|nr:hypothetical protein [Nitrospirota bacterium]MDP2382233.1 hypothetical protein [Nitrospirota bacterium]MDP3599415.1 hypothetical protein [Nitrospirota bacterium]